MQPVFLITKSDSLAHSLTGYCKHVQGVDTVRISAILPNISTTQAEWITQSFTQIADQIEASIEQHGGVCKLRNAVAVIDLDDGRLAELEKLNPISSKCGVWAAVVAMLVLAFPEIHWVFFTSYLPVKRFLFEEAHIYGGLNSFGKILELRRQGFTTLFDATGLRHSICRQIAKSINEKTKKQVAAYVPLRPDVAAAIDDEKDYAYLNAYVSYRFGYRSHVLSSYALTKRVLRAEDNRRPPSPPQLEPQISLVFEDLYINFPDKKPELDVNFSNLRLRDNYLNRLPSVAHRIFITTGHVKSEKERHNWLLNRDYVRHRVEEGTFCRILRKPGSGIFDIWSRSGLWRALGKQRRYQLREDPGAEVFIWPPLESPDIETGGGHSAPGRLLLIASRLVQRAESILHKASCVPEALHGAVLALNAEEYLGYRTPTMSLEAIALKHQLEVLAECMFYGVEYNMDVRRRFEEIKDEVRAIGEWFHPRTRELSELNAEIRIVSELLSVFRHHGQFDEEQESLKRIRNRHRRLWLSRHPLWAWALYPARWYVEFLLGSVIRFAMAIVFWILFLGAAYNHFRHGEILTTPIWWHGYFDAVVSFMGLSPPHDLKELGQTGAVMVCVLAINLGFIHLGIFVSHLYSIIARR